MMTTTTTTTTIEIPIVDVTTTNGTTTTTKKKEEDDVSVAAVRNNLPITTVMIHVDVDVIIPVHNAVNTIITTIHSAMNQFYDNNNDHPRTPTSTTINTKNDDVVGLFVSHDYIIDITIHVCCYDDHSTDQSWELLQQLQNQYNHNHSNKKKNDDYDSVHCSPSSSNSTYEQNTKESQTNHTTPPPLTSTTTFEQGRTRDNNDTLLKEEYSKHNITKNQPTLQQQQQQQHNPNRRQQIRSFLHIQRSKDDDHSSNMSARRGRGAGYARNQAVLMGNNIPRSSFYHTNTKNKQQQQDGNKSTGIGDTDHEQQHHHHHHHFLCFLDSDDIMSPTRVVRQVYYFLELQYPLTTTTKTKPTVPVNYHEQPHHILLGGTFDRIPIDSTCHYTKWLNEWLLLRKKRVQQKHQQIEQRGRGSTCSTRSGGDNNYHNHNNNNNNIFEKTTPVPIMDKKHYDDCDNNNPTNITTNFKMNHHNSITNTSDKGDHDHEHDNDDLLNCFLLERYREVTILQSTWMMYKQRFLELGGYVESLPPPDDSFLEQIQVQQPPLVTSSTSTVQQVQVQHQQTTNININNNSSCTNRHDNYQNKNGKNKSEGQLLLEHNQKKIQSYHEILKTPMNTNYQKNYQNQNIVMDNKHTTNNDSDNDIDVFLLIHPEYDTNETIRLGEDLRFFHAHLQYRRRRQQHEQQQQQQTLYPLGTIHFLHCCPSNAISCPPLVTYRYERSSTSQSFRTTRQLLVRLRAYAFEQNILQQQQQSPTIWDDHFIIWGAGRDGKDFYKALSPMNQLKVYCFVDVDMKKIQQIQYYDYDPYRCCNPNTTNKVEYQQQQQPRQRRKIPILHFSLLRRYCHDEIEKKEETTKTINTMKLLDHNDKDDAQCKLKKDGIIQSQILIHNHYENGLNNSCEYFGKMNKKRPDETQTELYRAQPNEQQQQKQKQKLLPPLVKISSLQPPKRIKIKQDSIPCINHRPVVPPRDDVQESKPRNAHCTAPTTTTKTPPPTTTQIDVTLLPHLPVVVCVAMYRTDGALEANVESIGRVEGVDLWHFS